MDFSTAPHGNRRVNLLSHFYIYRETNGTKAQLSISTGPDPVRADLIVNNLDEGLHPFHLVRTPFLIFSNAHQDPIFLTQHDHRFYVLHAHKSSIGRGSYNPYKHRYSSGLEPITTNETDTDTTATSPYDFSRAVLRDTVQIPTRGYAVLRFRAENPGMWLFHCHVLWYLVNEMVMMVDVMGGPEECNVPM